MKNKRKTCFTLTAAAICLFSAVPVQASGISQNTPDFPSQEDVETVSYIIDFLDYDGSLLDSKICMYGDKLEDIKIPEPREDEQYIYQFVGWEPQIPEFVTDCASYMAVYQKIAKSDVDENDENQDENDFELEIREESDPSPKVLSNGTHTDEVGQISAISYDVISFQVETPKEDSDAPAEEAETFQEPSASENSLPETAFTADANNRNTLPENERISPQPSLPAASDSENMPEPTEMPVDIHTDTVSDERASLNDSSAGKEKKVTAHSSQTEDKHSKKAKKTAQSSKSQKTAEVSVRESGESSTPAPSLEKSGQISIVKLPVSLLQGILAGCVGSVLYLVKKYS